jgi:hypothetical protein
MPSGDPVAVPLAAAVAPRPVVVLSSAAGSVTLDAYPRWDGTAWSWFEDGTAVPSGTTEHLIVTSGHTYHVVATSPLFAGPGRSRPAYVEVGDANGDAETNVQDVFYLINDLFAGGPDALGAADVNGDGEENVQDVFYLINYLFAGGPAPV